MTPKMITFRILTALDVCKDEEFSAWTHSWLAGDDRTEESALAALWKTTGATVELISSPPSFPPREDTRKDWVRRIAALETAAAAAKSASGEPQQDYRFTFWVILAKPSIDLRALADLAERAHTLEQAK